MTDFLGLKINSPGVLNIVNRNREIFEPASDIVDYYSIQIQNRSETEAQLLFTVTGATANTKPTNSIESDNISFLAATPQPESVDVDNFANSFDVEQRDVFNLVAGWARKK